MLSFFIAILAQTTIDPQILTVPKAEAAYIVPDTSTTTLAGYARLSAKRHGVEPDSFVKTLKCESKFVYDAVGDHGTSFGVAQIHLPAHPDISKEEALDPYFSIDWAAQQFSMGNQWMWTCWRIIKGGLSPPTNEPQNW